MSGALWDFFFKVFQGIQTNALSHWLESLGLSEGSWALRSSYSSQVGVGEWIRPDERRRRGEIPGEVVLREAILVHPGEKCPILSLLCEPVPASVPSFIKSLSSHTHPDFKKGLITRAIGLGPQHSLRFVPWVTKSCHSKWNKTSMYNKLRLLCPSHLQELLRGVALMPRGAPAPPWPATCFLHRSTWMSR